MEFVREKTRPCAFATNRTPCSSPRQMCLSSLRGRLALPPLDKKIKYSKIFVIAKIDGQRLFDIRVCKTSASGV